MNIININETIKLWLETILGIECISLYDRGARPDLPYSGYKIDNLEKIGMDETIEEDSPPEPTPNKFEIKKSGQREFQVQVQVFGKENTLQYMSEILNAYDEEEKNTILENSDLVWFNYGTPGNLPINRDLVVYEDASLINLNFRLNDLRVNTTYVIESVIIQGKLIDGDNEINRTITID